MKQARWYFAKAGLWGGSICTLQKSDHLLAGYPKTGSTWIRYYLYSLLCQRVSGVESSIDEMNLKMPEFAHKSMFHRWSFPESNRIIKTHQLGLPFLRCKRTALIVRDPRDIVVSYYYYALGLKSSGFRGSISDVLRDPVMGVERFFKHYDSWRDHAELILKYEDLKDDPFSGFSALATFYKIQRSAEEIQCAIVRASFSNMRTAQQQSEHLKSIFREGHQFVRSGEKAQWKDLFSKDDIDYYDRLKTRYQFDLYNE